MKYTPDASLCVCLLFLQSCIYDYVISEPMFYVVTVVGLLIFSLILFVSLGCTSKEIYFHIFLRPKKRGKKCITLLICQLFFYHDVTLHVEITTTMAEFNPVSAYPLKKKNTYRNHPYRRRPPAAGGGDGGDLHAHILKSCTFYVINPELHKPELPETSKYLTAAFLAGDVHQSQGIFSFF